MISRNGTGRRILALILLASVVSARRGWTQDTSPYGTALDQTSAEFKAITESVKETEGYVRKAREVLADAYQKVKNSKLGDDEKKAALSRINETSKALQRYGRPLKKFTEMVGPVNKAQEVWQDLNELRQKVEEDRKSQGALAGNMRVIAKVMSDLGGEVPLIGDFIETYGKMTDGVLDATGKVAEKLAQERNQGMLGAGTYDSGASREQNEALKEAFPDLYENQTFEPTQPPWVYRPAGQEKEPQLIWDSEAGSWEKVPDEADASAIFRMSLRAGRRPDPSTLLSLCKRWDKQQSRQEAAGEILGLVDVLRKSLKDDVQTAFRETYFRENPLFEVFEDSVDDPDAFRARYMYNPSSFSEANAFLGRLYQGLKDRKADPKMLARMVALAKKYGIQDVLNRLKEEEPETPGDFVGLGFELYLPAPARKTHTDSMYPEKNTSEEEFVTLEFEMEEDSQETIPLRGTGFDQAFRREEYGGEANYRVRGVIAPDMSAIQSLTVSYTLSTPQRTSGEDTRTYTRRWSVTAVNIPSEMHPGGTYWFEAMMDEDGKYPKGFQFTEAEYLDQDTRVIHETVGVDDDNNSIKRPKTLISTEQGLDVSRSKNAIVRIHFQPQTSGK